MEYFDIYDRNGQKTGRTAVRGARLAPGELHLGVAVVLVNRRGEIFCTRRSAEKRMFPGWWETTNGGVLAGEDSLSAAVRELREETGIVLPKDELTFLYRYQDEEDIRDIYAARADFPAGRAVLQPGETDGAQWVPFDEWERKAMDEKEPYLSPAVPGPHEFYGILRSYRNK